MHPAFDIDASYSYVFAWIMVWSFMRETAMYEFNKYGSILENIGYVRGKSIQTM